MSKYYLIVGKSFSQYAPIPVSLIRGFARLFEGMVIRKKKAIAARPGYLAGNPETYF